MSHLSSQEASLPVLSDEEFESAHHLFRRGDIVSVCGRPWKTARGELSLLADRSVALLAPCLHPIPTNLQNTATRRQNRVVDLLANQEARNVLLVRSSIIRFIRDFWKEGLHGGANPNFGGYGGRSGGHPILTYSKALGNCPLAHTHDNEGSQKKAARLNLQKQIRQSPAGIIASYCSGTLAQKTGCVWI